MTEKTQVLKEQLYHPDRNERSRAAVELGKRGDIDALDSLIQVLYTDPDFFVCEDITWALVRLRDAALLPLIDLLNDPKSAARHGAAHTLGKIADPRAVDGLIHALQDSEPVVVSKAAFALSQIGDTRAIPALIGVLGHPEREVEETITTVLEGFGAPALPLLIAALRHERWQVREQAADILGLIGDPEAIPALVEALHDAQWQVRFAVVTALGTLNASSSVRPLRNDPDNRVRELVTLTVR